MDFALVFREEHGWESSSSVFTFASTSRSTYIGFLSKNDKSEVDITIRLFPNAFFVLEYHVCAMPFKPVSCDHVVWHTLCCICLGSCSFGLETRAISTHPCYPRNFDWFSWEWSKKKSSKMVDSKISVFLSWPFWRFFFKKKKQCFIPMNISHKLYDRMDGT